MNKKTISSAFDSIILKLKVLSKEKEDVRKKLEVTAEALATTAEEKEDVRKKLALTAEELEDKAEALATTAEEREDVRKKLVTTADELKDKASRLATIAKEKESTKRKLEVTAEQLATTAEEKEDVRKKLALTAEEKEDVRKKLALTAEEKEDVRRKLAVTAAELKKSRETLEDKVIERTRDLANAKARNDAILASIGDGLVAVDRMGKILTVNNAFENLVGWRREEVLGKLLVEVVPREDEKGDVVPFKERILTEILTATTTATTTATWYYIRKDKTRFPAASIITPFIVEGKIIGAVEVFRDITHEKEVTESLANRVADLEKMNNLMVGRELKMIELKEALRQAQGEK